MRYERKMRQLTKKGFNINSILPVALVFVVTGIAIAYGLQVLGDVQSDMTSGSKEYNATADTIDAVAKFPAKLGLLATIVIAAIVLMILVRYLAGSTGGR